MKPFTVDKNRMPIDFATGRRAKYSKWSKSERFCLRSKCKGFRSANKVRINNEAKDLL